MTDRSLRLPAIDMLRGVAIAAMVAYHFVWDLGFFGLIPVDVGRHPVGKVVAAVIAASFLVLVGVSLALAARHGLDHQRFLRRLALVAGGAALVTLATWYATPAAFVRFGILHCIAAGSLLALPFLRVHPALALVAAGLALVLPAVAIHPAFDATPLFWLGLGPNPPPANDFVPILPWFGFILLGLAAARLAGDRLDGFGSAAPDHALARGLAFAGRHSLAVYLTHQIVLMGLVGAVALTLSARSGVDADTAAFRRTCLASCQRVQPDARVCETSCSCVETGAKEAQLWTDLMRDRATADQRQRFDGIVEACGRVR